MNSITDSQQGAHTTGLMASGLLSSFYSLSSTCEISKEKLQNLITIGVDTYVAKD